MECKFGWAAMESLDLLEDAWNSSYDSSAGAGCSQEALASPQILDVSSKACRGAIETCVCVLARARAYVHPITSRVQPAAVWR